MGDRHAVETARSEVAALQVKNEKLQLQVRGIKNKTKIIKLPKTEDYNGKYWSYHINCNIHPIWVHQHILSHRVILIK